MKVKLITLGLIATFIGVLALMNSSQSLRGGPNRNTADLLILNSDDDHNELKKHYDQWKSEFQTVEQVGLLLGDSESAEIIRLSNFKDNLKRISDHNKKFVAGEHSFSMGVNQFSHLSPEEFKEIYLTELPHDEDRVRKYRQEKSIPLLGSGDPTPYWKQAQSLYYEVYKSAFKTSAESARPRSIDWRNKLGEPLQQGRCGSCYSFASTSAIQAVMGIKENLSVQEIIDCDSRNNGCKGGIPQKVFSYAMYNGVGYESNYPYQTRQNSDCNVNFNTRSRVKIGDFYEVKPSVEALETALQYGPVATAIDASSLQGYKEGIFTSDSCEKSRSKANHALLIVGYTLDAFIVRNSWGSYWGEQGYFRVPKLLDSIGVCGLYNDMSYPTKE